MTALRMVRLSYQGCPYDVPERCRDWEFMEVLERDILPQDVLPLYSYWQEDFQVVGDELHFTACRKDGTRRRTAEPHMPDIRWHVLRAPATSVSKAAPEVRRWNGTCGCGANTYTSCFFVEHEGECRKP